MARDPAESSDLQNSAGWVLVSGRNSVKADAESAPPRIDGTSTQAQGVEALTAATPAAPEGSSPKAAQAGSQAPERPTDDQILQQENKIK